jgi:YD repeat-containing protein
LLKKTDPKGVATITPTDDFQWSFEYDAKGNLTKVTDPERAVTLHAYNPDGTLASTTDANLKLTLFESYDANGLLTQVRDAKGQVTKFGHDDDGLLRWVQDPLHASYTGGDPATYRTYFEYDSFHRLGAQSTPKSTTNAQGVLVRTFVLYDENDNVTRNHAPHYGALGSGPRTTATYDAMDRRLEIVSPDTSSDPLGERTAFQYDAVGRLTRLTQPLGVQSTATDQDFATFFSYDALDRVIREAAYEVAGTTVTQTRTTHFCFSAAGDLVSVTAPLARLAVVDCASTTTPFTTRFTYDVAHRRTGTTDAQGRTTSATYDAHGNVETTTDAAGAIVRRAYITCDICGMAAQRIQSTIGAALFGDSAQPTQGSEGVTIVNNADGGLIGNFVGLFGSDNTMTLGSGLIVSRIALTAPENVDTLNHEYGHVAQAQMLGPAYVPVYVALRAPLLGDQRPSRGV